MNASKCDGLVRSVTPRPLVVRVIRQVAFFPLDAPFRLSVG